MAIEFSSGGQVQDSVFQALAQLLYHNIAHVALLLLNRQSSVDDMKSHFTDHGLILIQNAALEDAETLFHIAGQPQIHAGLVVFQRVAATQYAAQRHVERHAEIETEIGTYGEAVEVAHPAAAYAARHVAGEGGIGI